MSVKSGKMQRILADLNDAGLVDKAAAPDASAASGKHGEKTGASLHAHAANNNGTADSAATTISTNNNNNNTATDITTTTTTTTTTTDTTSDTNTDTNADTNITNNEKTNKTVNGHGHHEHHHHHHHHAAKVDDAVVVEEQHELKHDAPATAAAKPSAVKSTTASSGEMWTPRYDGAFVPRSAVSDFSTPRDRVPGDDESEASRSRRRRRRREAGDKSEASENVSETVSVSEVSEASEGGRRRRRRRVKLGRKPKSHASENLASSATDEAGASAASATGDEHGGDEDEKQARKAGTMDARALRKMEIAEFQRVARQREKEKQERALQGTTASTPSSPVKQPSAGSKKKSAPTLSQQSAPTSPAPAPPAALSRSGSKLHDADSAAAASSAKSATGGAATATASSSTAAAASGNGAAAAAAAVASPSQGRNISEYVLDESDFVRQVAVESANLDLYAREKRAMERSSMGGPENVKRKMKLTAAEKVLFNDAAEAWNGGGVKAAMKVLAAAESTSAKALSRFLHARHATLDKEKLGEFFGKQDELNQETFRQFLADLPLEQLDFLPALRRMISQFRLPGEGQVIDRVMRNFCVVYCKQNSGTFQDADNAHTLAMLILTLNTATHNPNEERKIRLDDWLTYCEELTQAEPVATATFLEAVWRDIEQNEIRMPMEGLFPDMVRRGYLEQLQKGFLGGWKRRWFVLADNCLYVFATPEDEDPISVVPLNGVMADAQEPTNKRASVLRVFNATSPTAALQYTCKSDGGVSVPGTDKFLLLAAPTDAARDTWIGDICGNAFNKAKIIPLPKGD
jgi:hypothetical protein